MRKNISGQSPWEEIAGYSRAVRIGENVHVAGTTAMIDGEVVAQGDAYQQTKVVLDLIKDALAAADASLEHVVRTRIFVKDISQWEEISRAHGEFFKEIRPASTMVQVAELIKPDLLVEIEVDAIVH